MTALILLREWQASQVEFWRPVVDYPDYDVSNMGRVRSWLANVRTNRRRGFEWLVSNSPSLLKFDSSGKDGRLRVTLTRRLDVKRRSKRYLVHRLVATAFVPNPYNHPIVNHLTGDSCNNWASNLEWTIREANETHARINGLKS